MLFRLVSRHLRLKLFYFENDLLITPRHVKYLAPVSNLSSCTRCHYLRINKLASSLCTFKYPSLKESKRYFSKKKKQSKIEREEEEESDSDDESPSSLKSDDPDDMNDMIKPVSSLRVDSVLKAGLAISKKKVEKEFYAGRVYLNGEKVMKKSIAIHPVAEVDLVKGFSPDNSKYLLVDRVIVKSIGKVTGTGNFPIRMHVLKSLTIENYASPWSHTSAQEVEE